jgi:hypothetical protein
MEDFGPTLPNKIPKNGLIFFTHDNGERPFMVKIEKAQICVYNRPSFPKFKEYCKKNRYGKCEEYVLKSKKDNSKKRKPKVTYNSVSGNKKTITEKYIKIETATKEFLKYLNEEKKYDNEESERNYSNLVHKIEAYQEVFLGKDFDTYVKHDGGSILVRNSNLNYTHISVDVKAFRAPEPILNYATFTGNGDVHYPFATTKKYTMFFEISTIGFEESIFHPDPYEDDPWKRYYGHQDKILINGKKAETTILNIKEIVAREW